MQLGWYPLTALFSAHLVKLSMAFGFSMNISFQDFKGTGLWDGFSQMSSLGMDLTMLRWCETSLICLSIPQLVFPDSAPDMYLVQLHFLPNSSTPFQWRLKNKTRLLVSSTTSPLCDTGDKHFPLFSPYQWHYHKMISYYGTHHIITLCLCLFGFCNSFKLCLGNWTDFHFLWRFVFS